MPRLDRKDVIIMEYAIPQATLMRANMKNAVLKASLPSWVMPGNIRCVSIYDILLHRCEDCSISNDNGIPVTRTDQAGP